MTPLHPLRCETCKSCKKVNDGFQSEDWFCLFPISTETRIDDQTIRFIQWRGCVSHSDFPEFEGIKRMYNPVTGSYYTIQRRSSKYKEAGSIRGLWHSENKKISKSNSQVNNSEHKLEVKK